MIFDFTTIKHELDRLANQFLRAKVKEHGTLASRFPTQRHFEGNRSSLVDSENRRRDMDYHEMSSTLSFNKEEYLTIRLPAVLKRIDDAAKEMAEQMNKAVIETMQNAVQETGNIMNAKLTPAAFLKAIEMMPLDFDKTRDKPKLADLTLFASPEAAKSLMEADANMTEEQRAAHNAELERILDIKYEEYIEREKSFRIID